MSRIPTPASIDAAPAPARPMLEAVAKQLGKAPNLFRLVANSPAALEGYLGLLAALGKGSLPLATRERIALAVAQVNGCDYCLSAHAYLGQRLAHLDSAEIKANRFGHSADPKAEAAVRFAKRLVETRGRTSPDELEGLRRAGYDDGQIVEIVLHVALNIWTNYINLVGGTEIDFPVVRAAEEAA